jgi:hypothetical protein
MQALASVSDAMELRHHGAGQQQQLASESGVTRPWAGVVPLGIRFVIR